MHLKWNDVQAMILTLISSYLSIECFNSQTVFCAVFLLKIPFIPLFYIPFSFIICFTKSEIHKFIIPKLFLQLKYILLVYRPIKCVYTNYIVPIRYLRHQIDKLYGTLLPFFVDGSGVEKHIVSLINLSNIAHSLCMYTPTDSHF